MIKLLAVAAVSIAVTFPASASADMGGSIGGSSGGSSGGAIPPEPLNPIPQPVAPPPPPPRAQPPQSPSRPAAVRPQPPPDEVFYSFPVNTQPDGWAALKDAPSISATRLAKIPDGTLFVVVGRAPGWSRVRLRSGQTGWIAARLVGCCRPAAR